MLSRFVCCGLVLCAALTAQAGGTVWVILDSPVNDATIAPGAPVDWSIKVGVSLDDNFGLSLLICELVQDPNNPAFLDIPHADPASIPPVMEVFNRPVGVTDLPDGGAPSGFLGTQEGPEGHRNLAQIGGSQKTFHQSPSDAGTASVVVPEIGQHGLQHVVGGSFAAPPKPGVYVFRIQKTTAAVLQQPVQPPPDATQVAFANVDLSGGLISFTVVPGNPVGDLNCSGSVGLEDIDAFALAVTDPAAYAVQYPGCDAMLADCDGNGTADLDDFNAFVATLSGML